MRFEPERDEAIGAYLITDQGELPLDAGGTGLLQAIQILAYAARETPPLLLLDEPDSHLHPDKQRALMRLLQRLAEKGDFQVIIATHSRHMIDALDDETGLHWMSGGAVRPNAETDLVSVLTELGALDRGDLLRNGAIDAVVLTEDRNPKVIAPLLVAAGFDPERIQVWSYNTCTQIQRARLLADFIAQHAPATQVIVHADRDYQSDEAVLAKQEQFRAERLTLFVTDGVDAESQYLNAEHINHVLPEVILRDAQELIDQARHAVRGDSLRRLARELTIRESTAHAGDPHHVVDAIAISAEAGRLLDGNAVRWTYGKKALGVLTGLLQPGRGNVRLLQASPFVCHADLMEVQARIAPYR
ncbi:ATP-dependent nuclease [Xanthomonas arboricola]|uniref:ATP-dependent nuclease n=1 Tax=Xanthomonas arboricola TaxID=56448 RepID=UPI0021550769|nr:ATP-binding protein [Xanthomonas arboricola]